MRRYSHFLTFALLTFTAFSSALAQRHSKPAPSPKYCEEYINRNEPICKTAQPAYCDEYVNRNEPICKVESSRPGETPSYCEEYVNRNEPICQPKPRYDGHGPIKPKPQPEEVVSSKPHATPKPDEYGYVGGRRYSTGNTNLDDDMCKSGYRKFCFGSTTGSEKQDKEMCEDGYEIFCEET